MFLKQLVFYPYLSSIITQEMTGGCPDKVLKSHKEDTSRTILTNQHLRNLLYKDKNDEIDV